MVWVIHEKSVVKPFASESNEFPCEEEDMFNYVKEVEPNAKALVN